MVTYAALILVSSVPFSLDVFADAAKEKLKMAELLGYGGKDDYKLLYTAIDDIKETIHSEKSASTWEKVKKTLTDLKNKIIPAKK